MREFDRKVERAQNTRLERLVAGTYSRRPNKEKIQAALEQAAAVSGRRIVLRDREGNVVGDSSLRFDDLRKSSSFGGRRLPVIPIKGVGGQELGSILVVPGDAPETAPDPPVSQVTSALNRSLIWTGLIAGGAGIVLISLVSRRVLVPVRRLSSAAERLGEGDLSERVPESGPGDVKRLASSFNAMAENLQEADKQRRNLVADVAHEVRTPVSNIQIHLEAIEDGLLAPDDAIEKIRWQTSHLTTLIEDLRLLSMAEAGSLRLTLEDCTLEELLSQAVEAVRPKAEARGIATFLETLGEPSTVRVDKTRISQVMANLLDNAIFHTPQGGSVTVSSAVKDGSKVEVAVADTGEGIPEEALALVFERFYRVDQSRTRATGGTGLRLTITRQLPELHGGSIRQQRDRPKEPGSFSSFLARTQGPRTYQHPPARDSMLVITPRTA